MPTPLTPDIARAHEALTPRVKTLLTQVERTATRHPEAPVPAATRDVAQGLFRAARKILGREVGFWAGRADTNLGGLSVALGQLAAGLEAFEAAHSGFSAAAHCVVWHLAGPEIRPVTRLKPRDVETGPAPADGQPSPAVVELKRLIMARFAAGYDEGYRDASEGRPPASRYAETVWAGLVAKAGDDETARRRKLETLYGTATPPPHLMPVGARPGEWQRIEAERQAVDEAERAARNGVARRPSERCPWWSWPTHPSLPPHGRVHPGHPDSVRPPAGSPGHARC